MTSALMNRCVLSIGFLGAASLLVGACGDDGGETCGGVHDPCEGTGEPLLTDPEGGSIYFEYMDFSPEVTAAGFPDKATRVMGHFVREMSTDAFPIPESCADLTNTPHWPTAMSETMTELNVGNLEIIGAPETLVVEPTLNGTDMISRDHDVFYQYFGPETTDDYIVKDSWYDLNVTGSDEYPATTYERAFYMPPEFAVTSPLLEATEAPITGDWEMTWEANQANDSGVEQFQLVMLVSPDGGIIHQFCPSALSGSFSVPEDVLAKFRATYADGGLLLRGTLTHMLGRFDDNAGVADRRIDFVSIHCYIQPFAFAAE